MPRERSNAAVVDSAGTQTVGVRRLVFCQWQARRLAGLAAERTGEDYAAALTRITAEYDAQCDAVGDQP